MGVRYRQELDLAGAMLSVEFETRNREVAAYAVVLLFSSGAERQTIRVYDSTHGFNEMHRYSRIGGKQAGTVFHSGTLGEGMREAIDDVKRNHAQMIEGWFR